MELYFKDLISKESSLEKLVDDLNLLVQGADDFARAVGPGLPEQTREEVTGKLQELKERCRILRDQAMVGARATDKFVRAHPYALVAAALSVGLIVGFSMLGRHPVEISSSESAPNR